MAHIVEVYDIRIIDEITGEKQVPEEDQMMLCDRCGKKHVIVYVVKDGEKLLHVGATCAKRIKGLMVDSYEIKALTLKSEIKAKEEACKVSPLIEVVAQAVKADGCNDWLSTNKAINRYVKELAPYWCNYGAFYRMVGERLGVC